MTPRRFKCTRFRKGMLSWISVWKASHSCKMVSLNNDILYLMKSFLVKTELTQTPTCAELFFTGYMLGNYKADTNHAIMHKNQVLNWGITVFKIFICEGILSDKRSEILFYGAASYFPNEKFEYGRRVQMYFLTFTHQNKVFAIN